MLHLQRMSPLTGRTATSMITDEDLIWAEAYDQIVAATGVVQLTVSCNIRR